MYNSIEIQHLLKSYKGAELVLAILNELALFNRKETTKDIAIRKALSTADDEFAKDIIKSGEYDEFYDWLYSLIP